ncbi:MAG: hypothetical protein SF028_12615 [Candidatus Sumerlaeia bacterium]|nr:hypothetical protein [Candidatus Sumerlaeia bacterium]
MPTRRTAALLATALLLAGSAPLPGQIGAPPPVQEAGAAPAPEAPGGEASARPARVYPLADLGELPQGFWAHGTFGDTVLENGEVSFVFGRMPAEGEEANPRRNGTLLDIFDDARSVEGFWLTSPTVNDSNSLTLAATAMTSSVDEETGTATVTVTMESQVTPGLEVVTDYTLSPGRHGLVATSRVRNSTASPIRIEGYGDFIGWGGMGTFLPSHGWAAGQTIEAPVEFLYGRYHESFVMIANDQGLAAAKHAGLSSRLMAGGETVLDPGAERAWTRHILASTDSPLDAWNDLIATKPATTWGTISGRAIERTPLEDGTVVERDVARHTDIMIRTVKRADLPSTYVARFYLSGRTDSSGRYRVNLPAGEYSVDVLDGRRLFSPARLGITVDPGKVAGVDHGVSGAATLIYEVVDKETQKPIPAKLSLVPLRGTTPAILGRTGELASDATVYTATGRGAIEVPLGNFRLVASHGPEYNTAEERVSFTPPETARVRLELGRAFTPEGWISADLAVRTSNTPNVRTTPEDRVVTAAAEGLHWIMTADTKVATDLRQAVASLGLGDYVRPSAGFRLPGETLPATGDLLVGPLELMTPAQLELLAGAANEDSPAALMRSLREAAGDALLLAKRPVFPEVGVLDALGGVQDYAMVPRDAFELPVDGFEVVEGKRQTGYSLGAAARQELYSKGFRFTPFGSSGSAGTWNSEPGYPRIYIKSSTRDPKALDFAELAANFRAGKVQITNGPFVDFRIGDAEPGSTVTLEPGSNRVESSMRVYGADWTTISSITILVNGQFSRQVFLPQSITKTGGLLYPRPGTEDEESFTIFIPGDCVVEVLVEGDPGTRMDPVNPHQVPTVEPGVSQGQRTFALSAPYFVDADGDGKVTIPPYIDEEKVRELLTGEDPMDGGPF